MTLALVVLSRDFFFVGKIHLRVRKAREKIFPCLKFLLKRTILIFFAVFYLIATSFISFSHCLYALFINFIEVFDRVFFVMYEAESGCI